MGARHTLRPACQATAVRGPAERSESLSTPGMPSPRRAFDAMWTVSSSGRFCVVPADPLHPTRTGSHMPSPRDERLQDFRDLRERVLRYPANFGAFLGELHRFLHDLYEAAARADGNTGGFEQALANQCAARGIDGGGRTDEGTEPTATPRLSQGRSIPPSATIFDRPAPPFSTAVNSCLSKDRDALLAFYDFPAEHWGHLRTTNPIESTFSTTRLRHRRTKGSGSRKASLTMMFTLAQSASRR
jgi:hypothetical protein